VNLAPHLLASIQQIASGDSRCEEHDHANCVRAQFGTSADECESNQMATHGTQALANRQGTVALVS